MIHAPITAEVYSLVAIAAATFLAFTFAILALACKAYRRG